MRRCGRVASAAEFAPSFPRRLAWQSARALAGVKPKLVRAARPRGRALRRRRARLRNRRPTAARAGHTASSIGAAHIEEGAAYTPAPIAAAHIEERTAHTASRVEAAQVAAAHIEEEAGHNIAAVRTARRHIAAHMANWPIAPAAMAGSPPPRCVSAVSGQRPVESGQRPADARTRARRRGCCWDFRRSERFRSCSLPRRPPPRTVSRRKRRDAIVAWSYIYPCQKLTQPQSSGSKTLPK